MTNHTAKLHTPLPRLPLTILRIPGTQAANVRAPLKLIRRIALDPFTFPTSTSDPRMVDGEAILTATYSKLYYKGGGWWYLVGYAHDGCDVSSLLSALTRFARGDTPVTLTALTNGTHRKTLV